MKAWLMITTEDPVFLGAGYDDDAARYYSWDNTVPSHAAPAVGDAIILWDKEFLIGASLIDKIERGDSTKIRLRCPICSKTKMQSRKKKKPRYWCPECKQGVTHPEEDSIEVSTYRSYHESSWVELAGELDGGQLRSICHKPKSQHAIRELDWDKFQLEFKGKMFWGAVEKLFLASGKHIASEKHIIGGFKMRAVKSRRGQQAFRKKLIREYGESCALSGAAPAQVLDAAHLYSYAAEGKHHDFGGLMIRKDLHRLFDLGLITVAPESLKMNVSKSLSAYPVYQSLDNAKIAVDVTAKTKKWLRQHWEFWNGSEN